MKKFKETTETQIKNLRLELKEKTSQLQNQGKENSNLQQRVEHLRNSNKKLCDKMAKTPDNKPPKKPTRSTG